MSATNKPIAPTFHSGHDSPITNPAHDLLGASLIARAIHQTIRATPEGRSRKRGSKPLSHCAPENANPSLYRNLYHRLVKTTLNINDRLLADAKSLAAQQRTSLTRLIEQGLQMRLRAQAAAPRGKLRLPVFKGRGGLVAGVNPLSNKALLKALGDDA